MSTYRINVDQITIHDDDKDLSGICPHCGSHSSWIQLGSRIEQKVPLRNGGFVHQPILKSLFYGQYYCSIKYCRGYIIALFDRSGNIIETMPPVFLSFNSKDIPSIIIESFKEAIKCHAYDCFKASAIMVRRTLEGICKENSATGKNLYDRLESLKNKVVLPDAIRVGIHDLRFLGNDAAHIESEHFNVGEEEVEAAIEITKFILKNLYQVESIMQKLSSLKKKKGED